MMATHANGQRQVRQAPFTLRQGPSLTSWFGISVFVSVFSEALWLKYMQAFRCLCGVPSGHGLFCHQIPRCTLKEKDDTNLLSAFLRDFRALWFL